MKPAEIAQRIEHSLLKADATEVQIVKLCQEALDYGFYSVCLNPSYIKKAREILKGSPVRVTTVIGFPLGAGRTEARAFEALEAATHGASEIDIVMDIGAAKSGRWDKVQQDLSDIIRMVSALGEPRIITKVIIETCYLIEDEKLRALEAAVAAGADYVKTSTGFGPSGATVQDVALISKALRGRARVKAAGGIRDLETFLAMVKAGADLIGTSSGPLIIDQTKAAKVT